MNKIEKHLFAAGAFGGLYLVSTGGVVTHFRRWIRDEEEEIPWVCHKFDELMPCCWEGPGLPEHPRHRMMRRVLLLWWGGFWNLYTNPRPVYFDCAPLHMNQAYYEFYLGHVKLSALPVVSVSRCMSCREPLGINDDPESNICADCERYDEYAAARYAELEECYRCGEISCICDNEDDESDEYEPFDYDPDYGGPDDE